MTGKKIIRSTLKVEGQEVMTVTHTNKTAQQFEIERYQMRQILNNKHKFKELQAEITYQNFMMKR